MHLRVLSSLNFHKWPHQPEDFFPLSFEKDISTACEEWMKIFPFILLRFFFFLEYSKKIVSL